jgi:hypothetical protein
MTCSPSSINYDMIAHCCVACPVYLGYLVFWLNETNQMEQTNQINQINQTNQINLSRPFSESRPAIQRDVLLSPQAGYRTYVGAL